MVIALALTVAQGRVKEAASLPVETMIPRAA
jgi:hypothetical protein